MCKIKMKDFEEAAAGCFGNISAIARKLSVSRSTVYLFLKKTPSASACIESGREAFDDLAEETLQRKIIEGDTTLLKFYASTRLKKRGYAGDEPEAETTPEFSVTIQTDMNSSK